MLDLFAGSGSVSRVARQLGFETTTVDSSADSGADVCVDVRLWDFEEAGGTYDWIHMSPPCTEYSALKRGKGNLTTANEVSMRGREILDHFLRVNPRLVYTVENPSSSLLQHQAAVRGLPVHETSYCCYGLPYRKHTKIWSNLPLALRRCPQDCCWGAKHPTAVDRLSGMFTMRLPGCLCLELCMEAARQLGCLPRAYIPLLLRQPRRPPPAPPSPPSQHMQCQRCGQHGDGSCRYRNLRKRCARPLLCNSCYKRDQKAGTMTTTSEAVVLRCEHCGTADRKKYYNIRNKSDGAPVLCDLCYRSTRRRAAALCRATSG